MDEHRQELARAVEGLHDAHAIADAVIASPVIAALQADAWQQGFDAGSRYAQVANINHRRRGRSPRHQRKETT